LTFAGEGRKRPHDRGCSSVGRALQSHCRGREFESHQLHQSAGPLKAGPAKGCQPSRPPYILAPRDSSGRFMQENEVTLSLANLRQGGCRVTVDWPRAQRTHLSFPTEEEAQRWMQRESATWIAGHRKNKVAKRA
jgi:hypothetical protein